MAETFIVILKKGINEDDVINRIKQIEGVLDVKPIENGENTIITVTRIWEKIDQIFEEELKDDQ